jgi:hypothetical protein
MYQRAIHLALLLSLSGCGVIQPVSARMLSALPEPMQVSIFEGGLARVLDRREISLPAGEATLTFPGVAAQADGASAQLSLVDGIRVLEKGFDPGSLDATRAMSAFVGRAVSVRLPAEGSQPAKLVPATLLTAQGMVRIEGQVYPTPPGQVVLPGLPEGQATVPTFTWRLAGVSAGKRSYQVAYLTGGLSWTAEYALTLADAGQAGRLSVWAAIANQSGADYRDALVTVVAGSLGRGGATPYYFRDGAMATAPAPEAKASAVDEFHRYELPGRPSILKDQTKQLPMVEPRDVTLTRGYRFESYQGTSDTVPRAVQVRLKLANTEASGLGFPLPHGRVLVYGPGDVLIGQDTLANTPVDETFELTPGSAFDIVGQHIQTVNQKVEEKVREESYAITLRNHKAEAVSVAVVERLSGDWTVTASSVVGTRVSANELGFSQAVPAHGERRLTYTLRIRE